MFVCRERGERLLAVQMIRCVDDDDIYVGGERIGFISRRACARDLRRRCCAREINVYARY
jgi:hypothetical protein